MKKIEAIIRKTKFDEVKEALSAAEIDWFSYTEVRGIGTDHQERIYRGIIYDTSSIERIQLSIIVRNINVEKTIEAIRSSAYTGEVGDGRIFIYPAEDAISIRTGKRGDTTLYKAEK
jgi:nitrogen regulatory protein P-II 1